MRAEKASVPTGWRPRLIALDIDGTLLKWVDGSGVSHEVIAPRVRAAIRRAHDAGAHIVLSSGRSPHGMTGIAEMLGVSGQHDEPLWIVASNGAVVFRYPLGGEMQVVHEDTFDAGPAVQAVLLEHPTARVAIEDRGNGYRVSVPFPDGELTGRMTVSEIDSLVASPVSRVIIRDPDATVDDFIELGNRLGLHGIEYVVGWTAWLDLTPVGVSKASGLEKVCADLGLEAGDVLAIGDGRNDVEMLRWAGRGVAMGQAVQSVIDAADFVTDEVDVDGCAVELERWFGV